MGFRKIKEKRTEKVSKDFNKKYAPTIKDTDELKQTHEKKQETREKKQATWAKKRDEKAINKLDMKSFMKEAAQIQ